MKIAFIGDSFCADTGTNTWPHVVKEKIKATQIWKGLQGSNQYTILKHTKKILNLNPDIIIFTHTDPYRLANRHDRPLGARPCEQHQKDDKIWKAGHEYYEHLMEFGFHELTHIALVKECQRITTDIKTLHLFSFSTKELGFRDYNWDIKLNNSYNANSLARISYDYQTPDNDDGWKTLPNHMNYAGNQIVSGIVLGMLN